jgi:methylmalonyl-CoA carboxyltransferase small subunit
MRLRISVEGKSYDVGVEILPERAPETRQEDWMESAPASVICPPALADTRPEDKIYRTPIAGMVVSVEARPRQTVRRDDAVMVIEAMKMQNVIRVGKEGVIEEIQVTAGQTVRSGQALFRMA